MFMHNAASFKRDAATIVTRVAGPLSGMTAGTLVETVQGWRKAETLAIGTGVYTLDGGVRPVLALDRHVLDAGAVLVRLPGGSFDTCTTLDLLPEQEVVLDRRGVLARVPSQMLAGHRGAALICLARPVEVVTPLFAEDEVIWTNSGARLYCAGINAGNNPGQAAGFIGRLSGPDADAFVAGQSARRAA